MYKLYKLTNRLGEYFVIAKHPTEAEEKLTELLDACAYGYSDSKKIKLIELIATEATDHQYLTGHFLIT